MMVEEMEALCLSDEQQDRLYIEIKQSFVGRVDAPQLMLHLKIGDADEDRVCQIQRSEGRRPAAHELLRIMKRKCKDWISQICGALRHSDIAMDDLATEIETKQARIIEDSTRTGHQPQGKQDVSLTRSPVKQGVNLTRSPRKQDVNLTLSLVESIVVRHKDDTKTPWLWDICVLDVGNTETVVMPDKMNNSVKYMYMRNNTARVSSLKLNTEPWGVTRLNNTQVAVTLLYVKEIVLISVSPDLVNQSTITTQKQYYGITSLDESTLVVGCQYPLSVDILDTRGNVKRSITLAGSILLYPNFLSTTQEGNILVSANLSECVVCLSPGGDVLFRCRGGGGGGMVWWPRGITSTTTGSILVVDCSSNRIIQLSPTGKYVKDLLTSEDDIVHPRGVCVHKDKLYVTQKNGPLRVYSIK